MLLGRRRKVYGLVLLLLCAAIGIGIGFGLAGAAATQITTAIVPQQPYSPGPFDSGQQVDVTVPGGYLPANSDVTIFECAAPNGILPTSTTQCDGLTGYQGGTITTEADGSFDLAGSDTPLGELYTVYALPDYVKLGETGANSANCGLGVTKECVLYIGTGGGSDVGMALPHVFSQVFQVRSDATDSGTVSPGDGTAAVTTSVSSTLSTVSPATQTVTGDGSDPATVTVTLDDTNSSPVSGKTVTLAASAGSSQIAPASSGSNVTDGDGHAVFTVTDATPETVTYTATDTTDTVPVTKTAAITFAAPAVNPSASSVVASPASVANDGVTASTVTVTLRDHSVNGTPAPIKGKTVTLSANGGSSVIVPATSGSNVTNASGQATFSVTDTVNESVVYSATDTTDSIVITTTASVLFGSPLPVSATTSTVVANPSPAPTTTGTTVTVTLLAGDGKTAEPGKTVSLALQSTSGGATITSTNPQVTDSSGEASFSVSDSTAESVTVTATDTTDSLTLDQKSVVDFEVPPPPVSARLSTVVANPSNPSTGSPGTTVTVTLLGTDGTTPEVNRSVTLSTTGSAQVAPTSASTNDQGTATFNVTDANVESVVVTATDTSDGLTLTQAPTITFLTPTTEAARSTITVNQSSVPADGSTPAKILVTLRNGSGNPLVGNAVAVQTQSNGVTLIPVELASSYPAGISDAQGQVSYWALSTRAEQVIFSAEDTTNNVTITQTASVQFLAGSPQPSQSQVTATPLEVPSDGVTASTVDVELKDSFGNPVPGQAVILSASSGSSHISHDPSVSDQNGQVTFEVTDVTAEYVTYTAELQIPLVLVLALF